MKYEYECSNRIEIFLFFLGFTYMGYKNDLNIFTCIQKQKSSVSLAGFTLALETSNKICSLGGIDRAYFQFIQLSFHFPRIFFSSFFRQQDIFIYENRVCSSSEDQQSKFSVYLHDVYQYLYAKSEYVLQEKYQSFKSIWEYREYPPPLCSALLVLFEREIDQMKQHTSNIFVLPIFIKCLL